MLKNKLIITCFMIFNAVVAVASAASTTLTVSAPTTVPTVQSTATVSISNCTYANGTQGDANGTVRDFCLLQTGGAETGQAHLALPFALAYYATMGCTAQSAITAGNCQNAANTIARGVKLAFHLDYKTLHKIRNAEPSDASSGCPCSS